MFISEVIGVWKNCCVWLKQQNKYSKYYEGSITFSEKMNKHKTVYATTFMLAPMQNTLNNHCFGQILAKFDVSCFFKETCKVYFNNMGQLCQDSFLK